MVYNKKRVHSSIGYVTPEEFEKSEGRFLIGKFLNWYTQNGVHSICYFWI